MPSAQHAALVSLGAAWLRRNGFGVVATEIDVAGCREKPDVIGFRHSCSTLIEVKVSRSDFLADAKKPERRQTLRGIGIYRFYLCPAGIIDVDDLPPRWGLLHVVKGRVVDVVRPTGNLWPGLKEPGLPPSCGEGWIRFQHEVDPHAERSVLYSIARRLAKPQKTPRASARPKELLT